MTRTVRPITKSKGWAWQQARFEAQLGEHYIGHPEVTALMGGLMATFVSSPLKQPAPMPRVLIGGPTSAGKSFLVQIVSELLGVPTAFVDASALTSPGYKGMNLSEALEPLIRHKAIREGHQRGLIVFDELDKLVLGGRRDEWLKQVESNLLPLINGDIVQISDTANSKTQQFSAAHVMVFAMGVFEGVPSTHWTQCGKIQQSLLGFGLGPEMVSRFSHYIGLTKPKPSAFEALVKREELSLRQQYQLGNVSPTIAGPVLRRIVRTAYGSPFGVRGARADIHAALFGIAKSGSSGSAR